MMSVMYGGPSMGPNDGRTTPFNPPITPYELPPTITTDTVTLYHGATLAEPQKLTVTARVDKDGNICLLVSIDGVQKAEVKGGTTASVTVDL